MKEPNPSIVRKLAIRLLIICFTLLAMIFTTAFLANKNSAKNNLNLGSLNSISPYEIPASTGNNDLVAEDNPWDDVPIPPAKLKPRWMLNTNVEEINKTKKLINKGLENWKAVASWGIEETEEIAPIEPTESASSSTDKGSSLNVPPRELNIFSRLKDTHSNFYTFFHPGFIDPGTSGSTVLPIEETETGALEIYKAVTPYTPETELTQSELIKKVEAMITRIKRMMVTPRNLDREKWAFKEEVKATLAEMSEKDREKFQRAMADVLRDLSPTHTTVGDKV